MKASRRGTLMALTAALALGLLGCEDSGKKSAAEASAHLDFLVKSVKSDVGEVRKGLPEGARALESLFQEAAPEVPSSEAARDALVATRAKVNDLDSAKSTFFLVATADGTILRNNLDTDDMAGKNLFEVYPAAEKNKKKSYYEFTGSWEVARGVNNRDDAQWCAAAPIVTKDAVVGYLVTGWSWSAYAYRLETTLRSELLTSAAEGDKVPLIYVYVIKGTSAYGAPVAPVVNGKKVLALDPLAKAQGDKVWSSPLEIEHRQFGVALRRVSELGDDVVVAVLRSET